MSYRAIVLLLVLSIGTLSAILASTTIGLLAKLNGVGNQAVLVRSGAVFAGTLTLVLQTIGLIGVVLH